MAGQSKKRTGKREFSGSHQRSWLWGHHAVIETMRSGRWPILEIFASQEALEQSDVLLDAHRSGSVRIEIVATERLEQLVHTAEHQGLVARLGKFPYGSLEDLIRRLKTEMQSFGLNSTNQANNHSLAPLVVVCDRIQDAFNFGAILRCCDGAAVSGVIVGEKQQAEVTPHVVRSSSGAVNYVPIARTADLPQAVQALKHQGLQIVAADSNATPRIWETGVAGPTALIVGSEAHGVHDSLLALSDCPVCIPMLGHVTSLNVAAAAGIMLYEIRRQQSVCGSQAIK